MISIQKLDIAISYGDSVKLDFELTDYLPQAGDVATFSVKATAASSAVLYSKVCTIDGNVIKLADTADNFKVLTVGSYVYDILITSADRQTLNFPANLRIKAVAHNVS